MSCFSVGNRAGLATNRVTVTFDNVAHSALLPAPFGILRLHASNAALQVERRHRYLASFIWESNALSKRTFLFAECTTWPRRTGCLAAWLVAAGLYGCGAEDDWQHVPAHDDFRHAHVLHPDYQQSSYAVSSASPDLSGGWGPEQSQATYNVPATQETHSGNKPADNGTYMPSAAAGASPGPNLSLGWTPQQFQQAYNVPLVQQNNKAPGYGIKVAIITVYHYSQMQSDLNKWASQFGITPFTLNIINQAGVITNSELALTASVAVQMVNTVSPGATVHVIEAKSPSQADIRVAIQTAVNLGANIVLMPFGADETYQELSQDYIFSANSVVWIAPSGADYWPSFPATSPNVIAVGGTTLSSVNPLVETAWFGAGAGISTYEKMPSYQKIPSVQQHNATAHRSVPDVAFNADPEYGAHIYSNGFWYVVGGNSVSTGFFTGVVAMVNYSRKYNHRLLLSSGATSSVSLQGSLYRLMSTNGGPTNSTVLHDVVAGFAGAGMSSAGPGYDIATGLGSLNVQKFIEYMDTQ